MKEVNILGFGTSQGLCDYYRETWGVNQVYTFAKRLDKLFFTDEQIEVEVCPYPKLDRLKELAPTLVFPVAYRKFKDFGLPIEIYPIEEIQKMFRTDYFSSSIAYMIAYALYQGYRRIWLYGCDYPKQDWEYKQEKPGTEYWMGVAKGMGVEVCVPGNDYLGRTITGRMYGEYGSKKKETPQFKEVIYRRVEKEIVAENYIAENYIGWIILLPGQVIDAPSADKIEILEDARSNRAVRFSKKERDNGKDN